MDQERVVEYEEVAVVSCDILGHSASSKVDQVRRVATINEIVADAIRRREARQTVWASGGDGGHVVFFGDNWQADAAALMDELCSWARGERIMLRITGHVGEVTTVAGADERTQVVGPGINFAGWLTRQATGDGIVVSDAFRRGVASASIASEVVFTHERLYVDRDSTRKLLYLMSFGGVASEWSTEEQDDYASLKKCLQGEDGWGSLYYAKRISQINDKAPDIVDALEMASRILKSDTIENRSFLESLRADELTEMLKLGHLVERKPGEVICRVGEPGESIFVILRGEVGVYNLEGKGFGGTAEPKYVHRAGEVVGELATALKRTRTADLVAMADVALLSFISKEVEEKLADTDAGRDAARQYDLFILDRALQHTIQVAPYLLGKSGRGPLSIPSVHGYSRVSEREEWEATMRKLRPHSEIVTVDPGGFTLGVDQVIRKVNQNNAQHGVFILISGSVRPAPGAATLSGAQCPLLWVDVPEVFVKRPNIYQRVEEPIMVLWIGARGVEQLSLEQRVELHRALDSAVGEVPPDYEYDVYLCHSSVDKAVVHGIKDRLWEEYRIRSWYDNADLRPGDSTRRTIEEGLMASRFLLLCASSSLNASDWANREIDSVLHLDVKRQGSPKVLVLKLYESESNDEAIPRLFRGTKRHHLERGGDFERLAEYILSAREAQNERTGS